jgi:hypothetical protein
MLRPDERHIQEVRHRMNDMTSTNISGLVLEFGDPKRRHTMAQLHFET